MLHGQRQDNTRPQATPRQLIFPLGHGSAHRSVSLEQRTDSLVQRTNFSLEHCSVSLVHRMDFRR